MEIVKLVEIFKGTLDQNHEQSEKQLDEIHKIIGFLPTVLQIGMEKTIEMPVRQAAVIYFKNEVVNFWQEKESKVPGQLQYSIHEQDRALIRNSIVDAVILAPDALRVSLCIALSIIIKHDFPERWNDIVDKIANYLQTPDPNNWMGTLTCMLYLAKNYEYKNNLEKAPLIEAMNLLGPILLRMTKDVFLPDSSEQSLQMQKVVLKTIHIMTQYSLPLAIFTNEYFSSWMEIFFKVLEAPVPPEVNSVDIDERYELPWYKAKKWALRTLVRIFERYGPSKTLQKEYKAFAKWYMDSFSLHVIQLVLKLLDQYAQKVYLPPRVVQQAVTYLTLCVSHASTWKVLKQNISWIIEKVIFPLMCYTEEDDELWKTDPQEYVRKKFDLFEDYVSPVSAAQEFLSTCCKKRKDMLKSTIEFSVHILSSETNSPQFKDGALHMLGAISDILLKKPIYHQQINEMLAHYVFPYFSCEYSFLRARAAWILHFFMDFDFNNENALSQALVCLQNALHDKELPVKVQAAISLQQLITNQEKAKQMVEPNINAIIIQCLNLIKESQNEDITTGLQKLIYIYGDAIVPLAVQMVDHLVGTLQAVLKDNDDHNDTTITAMGLLDTIDTVLMVIDSKESIAQVEPFALKGILEVINQNLTELYEECFNIVTTLTDKQISADMWKIYEYIFKIIVKNDGVDFLNDMMPAIHNFLTVDPDAFLADPNRIVALYEIIKCILASDTVDDTLINCVKLVEILFLQFRSKIQSFIPTFCEVIFTRLLTSAKAEELRNMCVQTLIVVLYIDTNLFFEILEKLQQVYSNINLTEFFFEQWIKNIDSYFGLHDRKVCILGLVKLLSLEASKRPRIVNEMAPKIMTEMLNLFDNLKEAYKAKANADADSSDSDSHYSLDSDEEEALEDDDNAADGKGNDVGHVVAQFKNNLPFHVAEMEEDDDDFYDDDDSDDDIDNINELTPLESYETSLDKDGSQDDEYIMFMKIAEFIRVHDQQWYQVLFGNLNNSQMAILEEVSVLAKRRQDAAESRKIEQGGGYVFANQNIPTSFNFGGLS